MLRFWCLAGSLVFVGMLRAQFPELPEVKIPGEMTPAPATSAPTINPFPAVPNLAADVALTPTRTESPIREFGGSVSVIPESRIVNSEQPFIKDLLTTVPGVDVVQNGGPGRVSSVFLRGQSGRATKVFLDGIPLNDPSSPTRAFDFGNFSALEIERIEVLRGPQSVLYGADAVGGVVNITSKRGQGPLAVSFTNYAGTYDTYNSQLNLSGGTSEYYYSFGVAQFLQNDFNSANTMYGRDFNQLSNPFHQTTMGTRFGWTPSKFFDVDVVLRYIQSDTSLDSFNRPFDFNDPENIPNSLVSDDAFAHNATTQYFGRIGARLELLDGLVEQRVAFNRASTRRYFIDPNSFAPEARVTDGLTHKFEYLTNLKFSENHKLTFGYDYLHEDAQTPTSDPMALRRSYNLNDNALYIQDHIGLFDRWYTTAGIRRDDYSQAGAATTYRIASIVHIDEIEAAVHGSYGTGFLAPSLSELFAFNPPFDIGNANLRPERARGFEYGFQKTFLDRKLFFDITYFRIDSEDRFGYVFDFANFGGANLPTNYNISRAHSSGFEVITSVQLMEQTRLDVNYTNTSTLDHDKNFYLPRIPQNKVSATLNQGFAAGRGNVYAQMLWVDTRYDPAAPAAVRRMDPYMVVNTAAWFDVLPRVRLFGRIDNLFDRPYEELVGYNTPRFSVFGGVKVSLGGI